MTQPPKPSTSTLVLGLVLGTLLINLFVAALAGLSIYDSRLNYQERAETTTQNLSRALDAYLDGMFDKVDLSLLTVKDEVEKRLAAGSLDGKAISTLLAQQDQHQPEILSIRIADSLGRVKYGSRVTADTAVSIAKRGFFIRARDDAGVGLLVSKPQLSLIDQKWVIILARRLNHPNGTFAGVVYINVELAYFAKIFAALNVGPHGIVTLRDLDLGIVLRHPASQLAGGAIDKAPAPVPLQQMVQAGHTAGVYQARCIEDGVERTFSYRKLPDRSLIVITGLATQDYFAEWWGESLRMVLLALFFFVMTSTASWLIYLFWKRRVAASEALRAGEEKHKALIELTDTGYAILDAEGRVTDANGEFVRQSGHRRLGEILGRSVTEWTADYDRERNGAEVEKCLREGFVRGLEVDYIDGQGKVTPIEINATVLKTGDSLQILALSRDITQRKKAESEMREALAKAQWLTDAMDSVPSYIYIKNKRHQYVYANRLVLDLFRCSAEELPGSDDTRFFPPETVERLRAVDTRVLERGEATQEEIDVSPGSPDRRVYWEVKQPLYDDQGEVWGLCGVSTDITERKRIEEALRQSEYRLNELFEHMSSGVAVYRVSPDGQDFIFTALNQAAERIDNLRREDVVGRNLLEVFPGAGEFGFLDVLRRVWQSGEGEHFPVSFYHDGRISGWRDNFAYRLPTGEVVAIYDDVTERKRAEAALKQLNETLEERVGLEVAKNMEQERMLIQQARLAAMGEMIGNIAHQWRQPLNALTLLLANVQDAYEHGELTVDSLRTDVAHGQHMIRKMSTTIDDFRNFFRPNKERQIFSLGKAVADAVTLVEHSLHSHGIAMEVESGREVQVNGFQNELSQVLLNIFTNAKEAFLERKMEGGKIVVSWGCDDQAAWIVTRDNAGGIQENVLPKIFDPYFTTKEKGTGIGLYMSKMIMEHMDGRIEACNVPEGVEFRLVLPVCEAPQ